jgi:hypothetical protein
MTTQYIDPARMCVWVHTWWKRDGVRDATLRSLDASDAAGRYEVCRQGEDQCKVHFFISTIQEMCSSGKYDWILRLEDDTIVNKHLIHNVCTWPVPHVEPKFGMGFLSVTDPVLKDSAHVGVGEKLKTPWRKYEKGVHFGGGILWEALTLAPRINRIKGCMCRTPGHLSCAVCPSTIFFQDGLRSYWHVPSLVRIDLKIPRHDGKVVGENIYGSQPFDAKFRRA